jgi:hypothetical protein
MSRHPRGDHAGQLGHGRADPLVLEHERSQIEHEPAGAVQTPRQQRRQARDHVAPRTIVTDERTLDPLERDEAGREHLDRVVVQLGDDALALHLLRQQEAPHQATASVLRPPNLAHVPAREHHARRGIRFDAAEGAAEVVSHPEMIPAFLVIAQLLTGRAHVQPSP